MTEAGGAIPLTYAGNPPSDGIGFGPGLPWLKIPNGVHVTVTSWNPTTGIITYTWSYNGLAGPLAWWLGLKPALAAPTPLTDAVQKDLIDQQLAQAQAEWDRMKEATKGLQWAPPMGPRPK